MQPPVELLKLQVITSAACWITELHAAPLELLKLQLITSTTCWITELHAVPVELLKLQVICSSDAAVCECEGEWWWGGSMLYKHLICLTLCSLWRPIIISGKIPEVGWGVGWWGWGKKKQQPVLCCCHKKKQTCIKVGSCINNYNVPGVFVVVVSFVVGGGELSDWILMCWESGSRSKTGSALGFVHVGEFTVIWHRRSDRRSTHVPETFVLTFDLM